MNITARQLAQILQGALVGNPDVIIHKPAKIEEATADSVSFIANPKYEHHAATTHAGVLIVNDTFHYTDDIRATLIIVKDAYTAFSKVLELYAKTRQEKKSGVEPHSYISPSARLGNNVYIGAFVYLSDGVVIGNNVKIFPQVFIGDNCTIGDNSVIYSGVHIYHDTVVGSHCIIHSGVVIGSDGFGFAPQPDGTYYKVPQLGNVVIEDHVEIGANTTIDRATVGSTTIRKGVKLDNLIMVAHNVEIGENTVIAAQTGISGSVKIGRNCIIAGQVGIAGHVAIADGSRIGAQSGITKNISEPDKAWFGSPVLEYHRSLKSLAVFRNLPELERRLRRLEEQLKDSNRLQ